MPYTTERAGPKRIDRITNGHHPWISFENHFHADNYTRHVRRCARCGAEETLTKTIAGLCNSREWPGVYGWITRHSACREQEAPQDA